MRIVLASILLVQVLLLSNPASAANAAYKNAENAGKQLVQLNQLVVEAINLGDIEKVDVLYNDFTNTIGKMERAIGKVSGSSNRSKLLNKYVNPSKITKERVIYEISQLRLIESIERSFFDGNTSKGNSDLRKLDRLKKRAVEIKKAGGYAQLPSRVSAYLTNAEKRVRKGNLVQNLGPQLTNINVSTAAFGTSSNGEPLMLSVLQGMPGTLAVTNLYTKALVDVKALADTTTGWSIEQGSPGTYYIGTTPNEMLYKYDVNTKKLTKLGKATSINNTVIWDLDYSASTKAVYGVTSNEGKAFKYEEGKGFYDYGTIVSGKKDAKSVAYASNNTLFAGIGSPVDLIAFDLKTKKKQSILPSKYKGEKSIQSLDVVDNLLFVKVNPSAKILYFDVNSKKYLGEFPATSFGVSEKHGNVIYYGNGNSIFSFDVTTKESKEVVKGKVPSTVTSFSLINEGNNGYTLAGKLGNNERYFTYSFKSDVFQHDLMTLPAQPIELHHIGTDNSGNIYSSGFLNGSLAVYSSDANETTTRGTTGQVEDSAPINGKMYLGVYPQAKIIEYQPQTNQKTELLNLQGYGQDRPTAVINVPGTNKLYIGTTPRSGYAGGALAILDVSNNKTVVKNKLIPNQSIVSLAYSKHQKVVYGGTSIFGKPNVDPSKTNAVLFTVSANNPNANPVVLKMPFSNIRFYSAITVANNGMVWGLADEILYAYDPAKGVVFSKKIVKDVSGHSPNGSLLIGKDGYLYGVVEGTMFKLNPNNKKLVFLRTKKDVKQVIQDTDGTIYFHDGARLWKYSI
ncbi:hypothetical protein [Metabacillus halosaccharovorans]|uniref:hypothetical protein n=1 Tax=Metabacillus halosaccharovorans TaxID=930124 RepID=UPI001FE75EE4|nr:hypothetical protein [Metabacillus halosaccharovorans]